MYLIHPPTHLFHPKQRFEEAKAELLALLSEQQLTDSAILVFANKADLPTAIPVVQIAQLLGLDRVRPSTHPPTHTYSIYPPPLPNPPTPLPTSIQVAKGRHWYIQPSCATTGDGLVEGLDWLSSKLKEAGPRPPTIA